VASTPYDENTSSFKRFYFGVDVGYGSLSGQDSISAIKQEARDDGVDLSVFNFVMAGHFGYNFNQYFAAQLEYQLLPLISFSYNGYTSSILSNMLAVDVKAQYPLMNNKLFPFVTAGYGIVLFSSDDDDYVNTGTAWEPVFAAGLEYRVSKRIGINAKYKVLFDINNKFSMVNMGLVGFNFYF
jgi:outer membrane protein W